MNFLPLYIKTDNSLLNSMIKIPDLIEFSLKNNIKALTITDNNMYGVMEFYTECTKNNIKPIVGLEVNFEEKIFILYAKNMEGYYNLVKIFSLMDENKLSIDYLKEYSSNLILILPFKYKDSNLRNIYEDVFIGFNKKEEYESCLDDNLVYFNEILC